MVEAAPFSAIRYNAAVLGRDLSAVLAPPYDVLDGADKDALLSRSPHNIVAIDLPHIPPKSAGPDVVYEQAARRLKEWLDGGVLARETAPAVYLYHQRFAYEGREYVRRMFVARLRLVPFSEGAILPHEQTFGGPKEDRLALMKATTCQLSPIFGLFSDPGDKIGTAFAATAARDPDAAGRLDAVDNLLWVVRDSAVIHAVVSFMATRKVYIADGHHRYGTALMYRDWLAGRSGTPLPADHPANFVMFVLAAMEDPGCLILPYHRAIGNVNTETVLSAWSDGVRVVRDAAGATSAPGAQEADIVVYDGRSLIETPVAFRTRGVLKELDPGQVGPWYDLDYAYLHRYLIEDRLVAMLGRRPEVYYVKSAEQARQTAREHQGVALLTKPTPMAQLRAVSEAGGLMPQKSTYFHPKLATGLAINPLS